MILYGDYFEDELSMLPYKTAGEHARECLNLLDMLLEQYLESKGGLGDKKAFSRGLVVTDAEMRIYLGKPHYLREADRINPFLAEQMKMACAHISQRVSATPEETFLPFEQIRKEFALNTYELLVVLLAYAAAVDLKYARLFAYLQDDITCKIPTVGLLEALFCQWQGESLDDFFSLLDKNGKMSLFFFEIEQKENKGMLTPLQLNEKMLSYLSGRKMAEAFHHEMFYEYQRNEGTRLFFPEELKCLTELLKEDGSQFRYICLEGKAGCGKKTLLSFLAEQTGRPLFVLDLFLFMKLSKESAELLLRQILLECRLSHGILYLENAAAEFFTEITSIRLLKMLKKESGMKQIFLSGKGENLQKVLMVPVWSLPMEKTGIHQRLAMWEHFCKERKLAEDISLEEFSDCYEISCGTIEKILENSLLETIAHGGDKISKRDLTRSIFRFNCVQFGSLASRVEPVYDWEDIEMLDSQRQILQTACDRYKMRNRVGEDWGLQKKNAYGNGVSILLYGPPGTGKTMAAQVIANEVGLELYRVDLSQISSKYIGETEKNLSAIFEEAGKTNIILFFDEADALFSKRTEVKNSNDKYANSETAYLLQKIEEYKGISILATNLYNNFDDAFVRRITYAVHFENPDEAARYRLWTGILPAEVPVSEEVDFHFFASQFILSGSNIKAILYSAAYMAAAQGKPMGAEHLIRAMKYEYEKLGKILQRIDLGRYAGYLL